MMLLGLILLTGLSDKPVWVKPDHVVTVTRAPEGVCNGPATEIDFDSGKFVCVKESVDDVLAALGRT